MNPLRTLRHWLGRPVPLPVKKTPAQRHGSALRCDPLEDRLAPAAKPFAYLPASPLPGTGSELAAQIRSTQPLQDLTNVVTYLKLRGSVDLTRSAVVFTSGSSALLQIGLKPGASAGAVAQSLNSVGVFDFVSANTVYSSGSAAAADLRERIPNDPVYPQQYHHPIIQSPAAWDRTYGDPAVVIAVFDDGLDISHPDLKDNVYSNPREIPGDGVDNDGNGFVDDVRGWDFVHNTNNITPDSVADTHGTQVAGLIAGRIDNANGVAGLAGRATILPLKVVGDGPTTSLALARAVGYAVQAGAKVINNSLNIDPFVNDPVFQTAVRFAADRGLLWVNSAGNGSLSNPARQTFDQMLLVAATDRNDVKTGYSAYGSGVDITAPGGNPGDGLLTTINGGGFGAAFGTSMAAALVSGAAALVWSANPGYNRDQVASALTGTAANIDPKNPAFLDLLGAGRLDAGRADSGQPFVTRLGRLKGLPEQGQPAPASLGSFTLRLVSTLAPSTVTDSNFELRWAGPDNTFNTGDDSLIPLTMNDGRPFQFATNQLDFAVNAQLTRGLYKFTARSGGLADPFGRPVDGDGDGQAGGDLVRVFGVDYQAAGQVYEDIRDDGFDDPTDPGVSNQTVFADLNGNAQFDRANFNAAINGGAIPDANPAGTVGTVTVSGVAGPGCDLVVSVLVTHPYISDLSISLIGPNGERIILMRNRQFEGKPGSAPTLFVFQDDAEESTFDTPTLVTRRLNPEERLDRLLAGRDSANGTWRIVVSDTTPGDTGTFNSATLGIGLEPCDRTDANGHFALVGLPAGVVKLFVATQPGWVRSADGGAVPIEIGPTRPSLDPSGGNNAVRIGLIRVGAAYGRVFQDNGDGTITPGDRGQGGLTVYADLNGDAIFGPGEPSAVTDANGNYVLQDLAPGKYLLRLAGQPGYSVLSPQARTAGLTADDPTSTGNDFLVRRDTGAVRVSVATVGPAVRSTPLSAVDITLGEPLPDFSLADLTLTRDGQAIPLDGATLIGSGVSYTLIGIAGLTAGDGAYRLTVTAPAPAGQPARRPQPVTTAFTVDATPPGVTLAPVQSVGVTAVRVTFTEPVTGLTVDSFVLRRNGEVVALTGAELQGGGANYTLANLGPLTREIGDYTLDLFPGGVADAAGNAPAAASASFRVDRTVPPPVPPEGLRTAVGAGPGGLPLVNVYDATTNKLLYTIIAYEQSFTGGVRVATGDMNGDGVDDVVVAPGPGGGPRVRVFDGTNGFEIGGVMAFEPSFSGGAYVAVGDFTGDGMPDIVVTPDQGGGPRVRVFDGRTLAPGADFFGIDDPDFRGGARAAVGDVNGDGIADLIVAAGFGGGPRVAVYDGSTVRPGLTPARLVNDFFAYEDTLRNGAYVAAGDLDGDGKADLIFGGGPGGGPRVCVLSGAELARAGLLIPLANFFAGDPNNRDGVRVAAKDRDGDGRVDIYAADGNGRQTSVRAYAGSDVLEIADPPFSEFEAFPGTTGGVYVG